MLDAVRRFVIPGMQLGKTETARSRTAALLAGKRAIAVVELRADVFAGALIDPRETGEAAAAAAAEPGSPFDALVASEPVPSLKSRASVALLEGLDAPRLHAVMKDPSAPHRAVSGRKAIIAALLLLAGAALVVGTFLVLRRLRREMDLSRLRTDMLSSVSHDFRTPLTLIRSAAETLSMGRAQDPEKARRYLEVIVREVQRLDSMVGNVMDAVRIDTGRRALKLDRLDVSALLAEAESSRRLHLEEKGFVFEAACEPGVHAVEADAVALRSALYNPIRGIGSRRTLPVPTLNTLHRTLFPNFFSVISAIQPLRD